MLYLEFKGCAGAEVLLFPEDLGPFFSYSLQLIGRAVEGNLLYSVSVDLNVNHI